MNMIAMAHGCMREASAKVSQSDAVQNFSTCPDTAVRQELVGGDGMGTLEGGENGRCKENEKNCGPLFFGTWSKLTNQPTPYHHPT